MGNIGMPELIFILVIALLIFGPKKLPELGKQLGKGLGEFKRASNDLKRTIDDEIEKVTREEATPPAPKAPVEAVSTSPAAPAAPVRPAPEGAIPVEKGGGPVHPA